MPIQWEITPEFKKGQLPKLNNPILIEGLPGIGNVGKIAVDYLIEDLKAKKLYSFFSYKFPHSVFVNENNLVEMPKIEMYYKQFDSKSKNRDLLILIGDIQPIDEESCYSFCDEILKIAKQFNCTEIITTGGIGLQNIPEHPKVYCTGNEQKIFDEYVKKNTLVEKEIFGIVGPIIGASGVLLGLGKKRGVKGVALLAETFGHPMYLGVKGAQEILKVLEDKFKWGLELQKMGKEIVQMEKEILKKTKEWTSEMSQAGAKARKREAGYIG